MKLAVAGKGGAGKTSISGTLSRLLARSGRKVLAIDGDPNPNLALTLGIPPERLPELPVLASDLLERGPRGPTLKRSLPEICAEYSVSGPDGVTLLVMAMPQHAGTGCLCSMHATVRMIIEAASGSAGDVCLLDTEASPEHLSRGNAQFADLMLTVVEPYYKSLETGRRMVALARDLGLERAPLVANKIRDERDLESVRLFARKHDLEIVGAVPYDSSFPEAEQAGVAPLDLAPDSAAVAAIASIARELVPGG